MVVFHLSENIANYFWTSFHQSVPFVKAGRILAIFKKHPEIRSVQILRSFTTLGEVLIAAQRPEARCTGGQVAKIVDRVGLVMR